MSGERVGGMDSRLRFDAFFGGKRGGTLNSAHFLAGREVHVAMVRGCMICYGIMVLYDVRRGEWPKKYCSISKFSLVAKVVLDADFTNLKLNLEQLGNRTTIPVIDVK